LSWQTTEKFSDQFVRKPEAELSVERIREIAGKPVTYRVELAK